MSIAEDEGRPRRGYEVAMRLSPAFTAESARGPSARTPSRRPYDKPPSAGPAMRGSGEPPLGRYVDRNLPADRVAYRPRHRSMTGADDADGADAIITSFQTVAAARYSACVPLTGARTSPDVGYGSDQRLRVSGLVTGFGVASGRGAQFFAPEPIYPFKNPC